MLLTKVILKSFQKKMKNFHKAMPCFGHTFFIMLVMLSCFTILCHASPDKICTKDKFSALQLIPHALGTKREIYYSPVTIHPLLFMTLFTPNFCLFKGGCPLCLKQVLVKFYFRSSFLERVILCELFFERFPCLL